MHLATIRTSTGETRAAVRSVAGDTWVPLDAPDLDALIVQQEWRSAAERALLSQTADATLLPVSGTAVLPPITRPAKVICCGLNYHDHIVETGREVPQYPTLFVKYADSLTGAFDEITIEGSAKVDWEAELAVVIGVPVSRANREDAATAILGYTIANDVSCRDWQQRTLQWFQGKAWDASTPIGPVIVTADEIDPRRGLEIRCAIGGETMQHSNTRELVFDSADLVSYISQFTRLSPGDIVLTGTPGGVGLGMSPQRWLADGEELVTTIEGIGELRNRMHLKVASNPERTTNI